MQGVHMYADNNDGRLPSIGLGFGEEANESQSWLTTMTKETGNSNITHCPEDQSPHWLTPVALLNRLRRNSYGGQAYLTGELEGKEEYNLMTRIPRPAATIFWVELIEVGPYAAVDHIDSDAWLPDLKANAAQQVYLTRHLGRANYGLVDGHSEPMAFEETCELKEPDSQLPDRPVWNHNKYDPVVGW